MRQGKGKYDWLQEAESKNLFFPPADDKDEDHQDWALSLLIVKILAPWGSP